MESVDTERTSSLRPGGREASPETHAGLNINIILFSFSVSTFLLFARN